MELGLNKEALQRAMDQDKRDEKKRKKRRAVDQKFKRKAKQDLKIPKPIRQLKRVFGKGPFPDEKNLKYWSNK